MIIELGMGQDRHMNYKVITSLPYTTILRQRIVEEETQEFGMHWLPVISNWICYTNQNNAFWYQITQTMKNHKITFNWVKFTLS